MGELRSVVELHVEAGDWDEAFVWADKHPQFKELVYVPYATSLAERDEFLLAQKGEGVRVASAIATEELTHSAIPT